MQITIDSSRIPHTSDGHPIFIGDTVWFYEEDTREPLAVEVTIIARVPQRFAPFYKGEFAITGDWHEAGNLDFYHAKEAVPVPSHH